MHRKFLKPKESLSNESVDHLWRKAWVRGCLHTWMNLENITAPQIVVQPVVGLCASCASIRALSCLLCSFSEALCLYMRATISVQQQLTWETLDIIVCRSLSAASTSGKSLCGALTELWEALVSVPGSGVARVCATCSYTSVVQTTIHKVSDWAVGKIR